mgnify:CR=1 FL=1
MSTKPVNLFLSWCHKDLAVKTDLIDRLGDELRILKDVDVQWWEDSHLLCGEEFGPAIHGRIDEADYGVMLLTPAYVASSFVERYEWPRFIGDAADKGALPVAVGRLAAFDGSRDYRGVERHQVFFLDGRTYSQLRGRRPEFAQRLATEIRRRVLDLGGYRSL